MQLRRNSIMDRLEQGVVLIVYAMLVSRIWPDEISREDLAPILLLISEGAIIVLLVLRRPTENISTRPMDWLLAAAGTFSVLMVNSSGTPIAPELAAPLIFTGMAAHVFAKFSLRRSFGLVAANRGVKKGGMYAFVRHPMYAGYMVTHIGYLLYSPSLWNLMIYVIAWGLMIARIAAEERILMQDEVYQDYARQVPYRLAPRIY